MRRVKNQNSGFKTHKNTKEKKNKKNSKQKFFSHYFLLFLVGLKATLALMR